MSLPPGFLDELRTRTSIAQVVGRKVSWDQRKSNPGKGDYWAPCPFHQEKTASFHVEDRKGFYYCFGCHAKGDALGFVKETENVSFMEAVEILAREAGMQVPARDPRAQQKADRGAELATVMDQAVKYYQLQLKTTRGAAAREYLQNRRLPPQTLDEFEIGFAPDDRQGLFQALSSKGVAAKDLVDAGLCIQPEDGGAPYDRFRGRIMFPIRDSRKRAVAFGGRAMDPNARAKYLNSNETLLFDKGRSLYNILQAREAAGKANSLIVAEGYMDVIALSQAGFKHAVAPLGTAITEDQLRLMWRLHPEPILALDGDKAGIRAAMRTIDLALPLLEPGKSLRFCILPEGQDPDDLIKASGAGAMQALLDKAQPMVNLLWQRELEGKVLDSPERRAAFDAGLRQALNTIKDPSIKGHYDAEIRRLRQTLFAPQRTNQRGPWRAQKQAVATQGTKSSLLAQTSDQTAARLRESVILVAAILNPTAALEHEHQIERFEMSNPDLITIRSALLAKLHGDLSGLNETLSQTLGFDPLDRLRELRAIAQHPYLQNTTSPQLLEQTLIEELDKHLAITAALQEIRDAEEDMSGLTDEGLTWRLQQAASAKAKATKTSYGDDNTDTDDGANLSQHLQNLIDGQVWVKKKR